MDLTENVLTTLTAVKDELEISAADTSKDDILKRKINAVSAQFNKYCGREFHFKAETEKVAGQGGRNILLSRTPIIELTEVKIDDNVITISGNIEIEDAEAGILYRGAGWPWAVALASPFSGDPYPGSERQNIEVTYAGGYVTPYQVEEDETLTRTLPYDLEQLCIEAVIGSYLSKGEDKSIVSESLMSASYKYERGSGGLAASVIDSLNSYRRVV